MERKNGLVLVFGNYWMDLTESGASLFPPYFLFPPPGGGGWGEVKWVLLSLSFLIFKCVCFGKFLSFGCLLMLTVFKLVMI